MKCVDCQHCQVCALRKGSIYADIDCGDFKDKKCITELAVPLGTTVYIIGDRICCDISDDKDCPYWDCDGCEYDRHEYEIAEVTINTYAQSDAIKNRLGDNVFLTKEKAQREIDRLNALHEEQKDESRIF